jgi:putative ABC transport system permease protein
VNDRLARRSAHDGVIDQYHSLTVQHLGQGIEFQSNSDLSQSLIRLDDRRPENQTPMGNALEESYRDAGFRVQQMATIAQLRTIISTVFNVIIVFLLFMALLLGFVGGLGLMGTMSINVLERTREIGVMRAIGATDGAVLRIVMFEGILIGILSWLIGALAALPVSKLMNEGVGVAFQVPGLSFTFSTQGVLLWLAIVVGLAGLASFLPAWNATRVTVRDVLSYE